jgi:hypothetical protein
MSRLAAQGGDEGQPVTLRALCRTSYIPVLFSLSKRGVTIDCSGWVYSSETRLDRESSVIEADDLRPPPPPSLSVVLHHTSTGKESLFERGGTRPSVTMLDNKDVPLSSNPSFQKPLATRFF